MKAKSTAIRIFKNRKECKMKKLLFAGLLAIVLGLSSHANAALDYFGLEDLGCGLKVDGVCQGNLIFDQVTDITWYNYKYPGPCPAATGNDGATIDEANDWAGKLTASGLPSGQYGGWQLPTLAAACTDLATCFPNYTCLACKSAGDDNAIGYLFWGTFRGSTQTRYRTGFLTTIDTNAGKSYWTSQTAAGKPMSFSFLDGKLAQGERAYSMAMAFGKVQPPLMRAVAQVQTSLTDFRDQMKNEKDAAILEEAIQLIANTQDPAFWTLNTNGVYILKPESGKTAFREAELAVKDLNVLIARGYAVQRFVDDIIYVARWLAQNAISDAIAAGSKPHNSEKGMNEMGKATEAALERYSKAWDAATKTAR